MGANTISCQLPSDAITTRQTFSQTTRKFQSSQPPYDALIYSPPNVHIAKMHEFLPLWTCCLQHLFLPNTPHQPKSIQSTLSCCANWNLSRCTAWLVSRNENSRTSASHSTSMSARRRSCDPRATRSSTEITLGLTVLTPTLPELKGKARSALSLTASANLS